MNILVNDEGLPIKEIRSEYETEGLLIDFKKVSIFPTSLVQSMPDFDVNYIKKEAYPVFLNDHVDKILSNFKEEDFATFFQQNNIANGVNSSPRKYMYH